MWSHSCPVYVCDIVKTSESFHASRFSNPIRYNRNIAWSSCRCCFSLLGSIWVNTQQRKEELNRKRAQEIYRPLYDELVNIHRNILNENPYPSIIEFRVGHQTMIPHPQYVEWQKIKLDSRYLQTPTELKRQMERLFGALDGYLTKRKRASDEVKRILDSVLEEFKLPPCRIENFGSVVLGMLWVVKGREFMERVCILWKRMCQMKLS